MSEPTCSIPGCTKPPRRYMCRMHEARVERHGDPHFTKHQHKPHVASHGYVWMHAPEHPLAHGNRRVYMHRAVLFNSIGPGEHACHWCGTSIWWEPAPGQEMLEVDHLDAVRQNNALENLVPSCGHCNRARPVHPKLSWTHCPNGHEYTPENLVPNYPCRKCLTCTRERNRRYAQRRRAAARKAA